MSIARSWSAEDFETLRQAQVYASGILARRGDEACAAIVARAAQRFATPIALISILDGDRQWFPARLGIEIEETPREYAFCESACALGEEALYVPDATQDLRFADNPFVDGPPYIRFYGGVPLVLPSGAPLGTLCVIDTVPRPPFTAAEHADFCALAREALAAILQVQARIEYSAESTGLLVDQIRDAASADKDALVIELDRILREVEQAMHRADR